MQAKLPPKEDDSPDRPLTVETTTLKVTSPNWDRDDRKRLWKAQDVNGRERYFRIDDEGFWSLVKAQRLNPHIIDNIKVQWAFSGEQRHHARVLKVLEYNDNILSEPLDDNALDSMIGTYTREASDQGDLFWQ